MKQRKFIAIVLWLFWTFPLFGQTTLLEGDLAIIGLDSPDEDFSFTVFVSLDAGTTIYFTDEEADGDYTIATTEGTIMYTAPAGGLVAGTVITRVINSAEFTITSDGNISLSNTGDGLIAYQGSTVGSVSTFLHGIAETTAFLGSFPGGFSNTLIFGADDGEYDGSRSGSASSLMNSINNSSNWITSGSGVTPFNTTSFTITTVVAEPSNHAGLFSALSIAHNQIELSWSDNDGAQAATGFLIVGKTGAGVFHIPADGTEPSNDTDWSDNEFEIKITHGIEQYSVSGLSASTNYNFKIYAYTNTGLDIDFKTNGTVPTVSSTTDAPNLLISELGDPANAYLARFVEIYNHGETVVDFALETWYLCRQTNGGASWEDKQLTGSIASKATYISANSNNDPADDFYLSFGFMADFDYGGSGGNGDDGYFLYYGGDHTSGTLVDAYGVVDVDGTGQMWEYEDAGASRILTVVAPNSSWTSGEWKIVSADDADMSPGFYGTTWKGEINSSWSENDNWDLGTPTATTNVRVNSGLSNYPSLSTGGICLDITIESGASLLGVDYLSVNGNAIVKQEFSAYSSANNGWHLIGSPVAAFTIDGSDFDPGTNDDLYAYSESVNSWLNHKNGSPTQITPGTGNLMALQTTASKSFTGSLNTSEVILTNLSKTMGTGEGWQLIGNPYPSGLNWGGWTSTNIGSVAQILKSDGTGYATRTSGQEIPACQGFFVQVSNHPGSLTIPLSSCIHSTQAFSAKSAINDMILRLYLDSIRNIETRIVINPDASEAFDWEYDAHHLGSFSASVPEMYTLIDFDEKLALNSFHLSGQKSVPLRITVSAPAVYDLLAEGVESFENSIGITLEDTYINTFYDFKQMNTHVVNPLPGDGITRYVLHFNNTITDVQSAIEDQIKVFSSGNSIQIWCRHEEEQKVNIELFTLQGRTVHYESVSFVTHHAVQVNLARSIYIVKLSSNAGILAKRILIN